MGVRGELFYTKVALPNRTYFFNVKENRMGDLYLNIVESKNRESGGFDRQSVILFAEDLPEVLSGFDEALRVLEKAARERKRNSGGSRPFREDTGRGSSQRSGEAFRGGRERNTRLSGEASRKPRAVANRYREKNPDYDYD